MIVRSVELVSVLLLLAMCVAGPSSAEDAVNDLRMTVTTETGREKHAGTDDLEIYIVLNDDIEHKQKLRYKKKKDDFVVGGIDKFEDLQVNCPLDDIEKIAVLIEGGKDAWLLRELSVQFFQDGKSTEVISFKTKTWFSCEKSDRRSRDKKTFRLQYKHRRLLRLK